MPANFPDIPRTRSGFKIQPATKLIRSPYNQVEEVWEEPGDMWQARLAFSFLTKPEARELRSVLTALRGHVGTLFIHDTAHSNEGSWNGTPVVDGVDEYGVVLNARGFAASQTVGKRGDRFQLNNRLHELTEDAITDGTGRVQLQFQPEIKTIPLDGDFIISNEPKGLFRLANPSQIPDWSGSKAGVRNVQLEFVEALSEV